MFKVGDMVTWTSQSGSYSKTKTGTVLVIVPAGSRPVGPEGYRANSKAGYGLSRYEDSYLIAVGHVIYWPRVCWLKLAEAEKVKLENIFLERCACGQQPHLVMVKGEYQVTCDNCLDTIRYSTPEKAADAWNRKMELRRKHKKDDEISVVADALTDFVNGMGNDVKDVVEKIAQSHRTLQQGVTRFVVAWLEKCDAMHKDGDFDLRNQASCELGKEFMEKFLREKRYMPLI